MGQPLCMKLIRIFEIGVSFPPPSPLNPQKFNFFSKWLRPNEGYADPPLSFDPTFMKNAQCAETNGKKISVVIFSSYREKLVEN